VAGRQLQDYCAFNEKYGPVARMGANIVSVVDPNALRIIYGSYNMPKGSVYSAFNWFGENIFSTRDQRLHRKRRHVVYPSYSPSALSVMEPILYESGPKALADYIDRHYADTGEVFDLLQELQLMRLNEVSSTVFGQNFNLLHEKTYPLLDWIRRSLKLGVIQMYCPILRYVRIPFLYSELYEARSRLREFIEMAIQARRSSLEKRRDILQTLLNARDAETGHPLSDDELVSELAIQLVIGNFPLSLTAFWTIYLLLEHPDAMKQLLAELDDAIPDGTEITDDKLIHLPYLDAVIRESMRHRPAMAEGLPRVVPKGGCTIAGKYIPQGTIVFTSSYALHHDPNLWMEPDAFRPERWLIASEHVNEMKKAYAPFSTGPRSCAGQRIAWMLLRLTLATLLRRFKFYPIAQQDMTPKMQIFMVPAGGKYLVSASRRK
jgi:benzoate 4-monooxygenase